jgi:hypothetical protein
MGSSRWSLRIMRQSAVSASIALTALAVGQDHTAAHSQWVYFNHSKKLVYKSLKTGDRIVDFSYAGYMGGGVALPVVPVRRTVSPYGGDDSAAIQAAIDEVSQIAPVGGVRGAVLLSAGHFHCTKTLTIGASGVVLRGSGSGEAETTIELTGDPHIGISIAGESKIEPLGKTTTLADAYVSAGSLSLRVRDVSLFHAGDIIQIVRPVTTAWLHFMEMDEMVRAGKKQTWVAGELTTERIVRAIEGNKLLLDVPLTDSYDAKYLGADGTTVGKIEHVGEIGQAGVEYLRIVAPARKITLNDRPFNGLVMKNAVDSWVRNLRFVDTTEAVAIAKGTRRITVDQVDAIQSIPIQGAAKPADFSAGGTQILFNRCTGSGDNVFYVVTGDREQGPNVVLNCVFHGNGHLQPHQRWATGLLVDSCQVPEGGIDLMNRGSMGSGHGWTMGWGVVWNSTAKSFVIQMPPGSANWSIGNSGEQALGSRPTFDPGPSLPLLPQGFVESQSQPVTPSSLYLEQLKERLGPQAVKNIGY